MELAGRYRILSEIERREDSIMLLGEDVKNRIPVVITYEKLDRFCKDVEILINVRSEGIPNIL